jgi:hypothetical protein
MAAQQQGAGMEDDENDDDNDDDDEEEEEDAMHHAQSVGHHRKGSASRRASSAAGGQSNSAAVAAAAAAAKVASHTLGGAGGEVEDREMQDSTPTSLALPDVLGAGWVSPGQYVTLRLAGVPLAAVQSGLVPGVPLLVCALLKVGVERGS